MNELPEWIQDARQRGSALIALEDRKQYETQGSILWHEHGLDLVTKIENQAEEIERLRRYITSARNLLETHPMPSDAYRVLSEAVNTRGGR